MSPQQIAFSSIAVALSLALSAPAQGQGGPVSLSGTVTAPSGAVVPNAAVSVKNLTMPQSIQTTTDSSGRYEVATLEPGDYELTVSAEGFSTSTRTVTIVAGASTTLNVALSAALSLQDLGFAPADTQGSAENQATLDRRSHMLKVHQRLGLITTAGFLATLLTSNGAKGRRSTASGRNWHAGLGILTTGLYITTASFAILAPKVSGTQTRGPIRLHKALAWIHGTGMVLTPILGGMALAQRNQGERPHGIASDHGLVATITAVAFGAAVLSVSIRF
jgi:hypothetical protein